MNAEPRLLVLVAGSENHWSARCERAREHVVECEVHTARSPLEGVLVAERVARAHGFGIRWHGLVGHGFELAQTEGATPA